MMLAISSRTKLYVNLTIAALVVAGAAALSSPASAAKISTVLGACKRSAGCESWSDGKGWAIGCGRYGCFECDKGKCHSIARSAVEEKRSKAGIAAGVSSASQTWSKSTVYRGGTAPVKFGATINNSGASRTGMGGKH